mmetsp:Transcript_11444/g.25944  ORF Transcript_11444/g.25944 Transcript_11444/m.25944 type:complete len:183 (+) Transcript_11444:85-633(+)|eukprot:1992150-Amphidinium_carterae.1
MAGQASLFCMLVILSPLGVSGNSLAVGKLCPDRHCNDPQFPVLDYDGGKCVCKTHPCWNDDGVVHTCSKDPKYPYLHYIWDKSGAKPNCMCSSLPHYDTEYIVKQKCPGHGCDTAAHPILDFDEDKGACVCRSHPCENADGKRYECKDPEYPILRYLTDVNGKGFCDCVAKLEQPTTGKAEL